MQYVEEEDVKFIRLAFCDVFGRQKNVSIMPGELRRAFGTGIAFDASAIRGFGQETHSDLFLHPDPATLSVLPWRPEQGRVVRMYSSIRTPAGEPFSNDTRTLLVNAEKAAEEQGVGLMFGSRAEFYLFGADEDGNRTDTPFDKAGYMDIAPLDKGENVRRQICLNLERMGISTVYSCHLDGSGQNAVKLGQKGMLAAADDLMSFFTVIKTAASSNGLFAELAPKPVKMKNMPGSGLCIEITADDGSKEKLGGAAAGIAAHLSEITLFLDPARESYERLCSDSLPQAVRLTDGGIALCSPDCSANPYLAFTLLIRAALDGVTKGMNCEDVTARLPATFEEAVRAAQESAFIAEFIPKSITDVYSADR